MYRRFSEVASVEENQRDFVLRKYKPELIYVALGFAFAFFLVCIVGRYLLTSDQVVVVIPALLLIFISLCLFTCVIIYRTRQIVNMTEFQNALFSGAYSVKVAFYLIISRSDRSVMYFSPSYRKILNNLKRGIIYNFDEMLALGDMEKDSRERLSNALVKGTSDKATYKIVDKDARETTYLLTVNPIGRPQGYSVVSAVEMVEAGKEPKLGQHRDAEYYADILDKIMNQLPLPSLIALPDGTIEICNRAFSELTGYIDADFRKGGLKMFDLVVNNHLILAREGFSGDVKLRKKNRSMVLTQGSQKPIRDDKNNIVCFAITFMPEQFLSGAQGEEKSAEPTPATPAITFTGAFDVFAAESPLASAIVDKKGNLVRFNEAFVRLTGMKPNKAGAPIMDVVAEESKKEAEEAWGKVLAAKEPGASVGINIKLVGTDGKTAMAYFTRPLTLGSAEPQVLTHLIDTTEQKNLEMRFTHSQKMQAVGQLAGGIAHDFNNLLTAMIGFCDLLLMRHPAGDQSFADIMQIKQNATRAANLVRQLLAFSRRQTLQPKTLDITDVLADLSNLLRRLIGENIELKMVHGRDAGSIKADQGQFEQVLINLAVNARDAMPTGGTLTIRTSNVTINASNPVPKDFISPTEEDAIIDGDYVLVEVEDTGHGIPHDIMPKIFEPFFSTKEVGSGTGLGLATVYGIVKQTGGYIYVTSKAGEGTVFHIYFKRHSEAVKAKEEHDDSAEKGQSGDLSGKGTILLVEDEAPVRIFSARALRNKGYNVIEADNPETALEEFAKHKDDITIIITDVIMPGMNGPAMVEKIRKLKSGLKVIFMSGYAEDVFMKSFGSERDFHFLPKPFTLKQLAGKVKEVTQG